jgi:hypothetical protein
VCGLVSLTLLFRMHRIIGKWWASHTCGSNCDSGFTGWFVHMMVAFSFKDRQVSTYVWRTISW